MTTTPEYGEEELINDRTERVEKQSAGDLPPWEDLGEQEVRERAIEDRELEYVEPEDNEAHHPGEPCACCGALLAEDDDARLLPDGHWVHETCP